MIAVAADRDDIEVIAVAIDRDLTAMLYGVVTGGTGRSALIPNHAAAGKTGQVFVIESRSGGSGTIGAVAVRQAPPDGHTLFQATISQRRVWISAGTFNASNIRRVAGRTSSPVDGASGGGRCCANMKR